MPEPQSCLAMVKKDLIEHQYSDRNDGYYAKYLPSFHHFNQLMEVMFIHPADKEPDY